MDSISGSLEGVGSTSPDAFDLFSSCNHSKLLLCLAQAIPRLCACDPIILPSCPISDSLFSVNRPFLKFKIGQHSTLPTPCPSRLKELIDLANLDPNGETRSYLHAIARAFRAKRQKKSAPKTIEIPLSQPLSISTADGVVTSLPHDLVIALNQIDPPSGIDMIRECPKCLELFWAGRKDKEACARHADALRKQAKRLSLKQRQADREKNLARRKEKRIRFSKLSNTAWAVIGAIMGQYRVFWRIDSQVAFSLQMDDKRPPNRLIVRNCLDKLVKDGYLTYHPHPQDEDSDEPRDPLEDRWAPTQKLKNQLADIERRIAERKAATKQDV